MLRSLVGSEMCIRDRFKDMSARLNTEFAAKEDLWTSMSVLDFAVKVRISPLHLRKVGSIIRNMQDSNITFTDDQINDVIRALFVEDSDENLEAAFKVFDEDGSGYLDTKEFSDTLKILGKDLPQHDIDELFETVDMDGNGTIDLDEFHQMMKQLGLRLNVSESDQIMASMSVLDFTSKIRISPMNLRKVGAIIMNMQMSKEIEFNNEQINDVIRALFVDQSEENMQAAFEVFDLDGNGYLDTEEFRRALPLLGEDVMPEEVDAIFELVDTDKSGRIEIDEFTCMVKQMNPMGDD
eukprot:TRINITY_DN920_c0_g1_i6.p1 TRINITY_DN920_c0_g1~~TRINITY_DN920_c0_g1_i6.p1  ORF type:complete len:331 (-),score=99.73 TRINITY_DN920_c0_g1_i6:167-1051(-)